MSHILRRTLRFLYLTKRLRGQLQGGERSIGKAARTLAELQRIASEVDLSGIAVVEPELTLMKKATTTITQQANAMFARGLEDRHLAHLGTALQAFYNLGELRDKIDAQCTADLMARGVPEIWEGDA